MMGQIQNRHAEVGPEPHPTPRLLGAQETKSNPNPVDRDLAGIGTDDLQRQRYHWAQALPQNVLMDVHPHLMKNLNPKPQPLPAT
jgi:hypothetical protein